jgi:Protein of unknown function (DUF2628)
VTAYTVHEPPNPPADRLDCAERLVFVKDGFSWLAALFTPLWMIAHRMWLGLLLYLVGVLALVLALLRLDVSEEWIRIATLALHLAIGFEAGSLQRWTLERRGWRMLGAVTGRSMMDCERQFLESWLPEQPIIAPSSFARAGGPAIFAEGVSSPARPSRWRRWLGLRS